MSKHWVAFNENCGVWESETPQQVVKLRFGLTEEDIKILEIGAIVEGTRVELMIPANILQDALEHGWNELPCPYCAMEEAGGCSKH